MTRPALRALLFFVAISGLSFGRQAEAQAPVFQYAAKFVVGNGERHPGPPFNPAPHRPY